MTNQTPIRHDRHAASVMRHLGAVGPMLEEGGLDRRLSHLVEPRVSEINGCAFCVRMHSTQAREDGETDERLDRLVAWRHMDDFTAAEKAAFAWAEALTHLERDTDWGTLRAALREHHADETIALLTLRVAMINLWNRVQVSVH